MSKTKSSTNFTQVCKNDNNFWDKAILEAEKQIQDARNKIKNLKNSIESFKILRENGEPFLSGEASQNEAKT